MDTSNNIFTNNTIGDSDYGVYVNELIRYGLYNTWDYIDPYTSLIISLMITISIVYTSGDYDSEVSFTVTSANSNVVIEAEEPTAEVELLNYCPDNL